MLYNAAITSDNNNNIYSMHTSVYITSDITAVGL